MKVIMATKLFSLLTENGDVYPSIPFYRIKGLSQLEWRGKNDPLFLNKPPFIHFTLPRFLFMSIADRNRLV